MRDEKFGIMETVTIEPKQPYDIKTHFEHYSLGDLQPSPAIYEKGIYKRAFRLKNDKLLPVEIELNDDVDRPKLKVTFYSAITKKEREKVIDRIKWVFDMEYDLKLFYEFMNSDPILRRVRNNNYGLRPSYYSTVYEAINVAIVQQQISFKIASHMVSLIVRRYGDCIRVGNKEFWEFPSPKELAKASVKGLRECKLSERKAEYIRDFSQVVAKGEFNPESMKMCDYEQIVEKLTSFRGMGRWTAESVIVTSIDVENVNPSGDLGARKAISHFYNNDKLMSEEEVRKFTEKWGRYKGISTYYLIAEYIHGG